MRLEDSAWVVAAAMSMLSDGVGASEAVLAARRCTDAILMVKEREARMLVKTGISLAQTWRVVAEMYVGRRGEQAARLEIGGFRSFRLYDVASRAGLGRIGRLWGWR